MVIKKIYIYVKNGTQTQLLYIAMHIQFHD